MLLTSLATVSIVLSVPRAVQSQSVIIQAGGAFPTSEFGDAFDTGWMVAGGLRLPIGPGGFWFGIEGSYGQNGTAVEGVDANPAGAMARLGFNVPVPGGIQPYVFGGAGLLATKFSAGSFSDTESKFGFQLGGGLNLGSGVIGPFVEARFESSEDIDFFAAHFGLSIGLN
ncbi:MAG: porin family protein [Gemmatimonadota bacterium]|nr:porin family protein [Gemmatimonadota bacterium]